MLAAFRAHVADLDEDLGLKLAGPKPREAVEVLVPIHQVAEARLRHRGFERREGDADPVVARVRVVRVYDVANVVEPRYPYIRQRNRGFNA